GGEGKWRTEGGRGEVDPADHGPEKEAQHELGKARGPHAARAWREQPQARPGRYQSRHSSSCYISRPAAGNYDPKDEEPHRSQHRHPPQRWLHATSDAVGLGITARSLAAGRVMRNQAT